MGERKVDIFMPIYVGDYLADTSELSAEEHGAYLLLMMGAWRRGGRLPTDAGMLSRIAATPRARWARVWGMIGRFFQLDGDALIQRRVTKELAAAEARRLAASRNGKASSEARKAQRNGNGKSTGVDLALTNGSGPVPTERSTESNSSPSGSLSSSPLSHPDPERALTGGEVWSGWKWMEKFGHAWANAKGTLTYGRGGDRDSRAAGELRDILESLPSDERIATQLAAPAMFKAFLAETGKVAAAGHLFSWFVNGFNGLRVACRQAPAERRAERVLPLKAEPRPPRRAEVAG